jgi:hypothetical protein
MRTTITAGIVAAMCAAAVGLAPPASAVAGPSPTAAPALVHDGGAGAPKDGGEALLAEVKGELGAVRDTGYQHTTEVDRSRGAFFYDCSGFVDYTLGRARPAALRALPETASAGRPLAKDYEHYLRALDRGGSSDTWTSVPSVAALRPGDVIAWLTPPDSDSDDTGHVMIVLDRPVPGRQPSQEWLIRVADSTVHRHARDSRDDADGLGTGTIGLVADRLGQPTGFFWRGGLSTVVKTTEIALGRPK